MDAPWVEHHYAQFLFWATIVAAAAYFLMYCLDEHQKIRGLK
jgi:hypothetical protein